MGVEWFTTSSNQYNIPAESQILCVVPCHLAQKFRKVWFSIFWDFKALFFSYINNINSTENNSIKTKYCKICFWILWSVEELEGMRLQPSRGQENCFLWFHCCVALFWYYVLRVKKFRYEIEKFSWMFPCAETQWVKKVKNITRHFLVIVFFCYLDSLKSASAKPKNWQSPE